MANITYINFRQLTALLLFLVLVKPGFFQRAVDIYNGAIEIKSKGLARERQRLINEVKFNNTAVLPVSHPTVSGPYPPGQYPPATTPPT